MCVVTKFRNIAVLLGLLTGTTAQAVTINFDDREYIPTPIFDHFGDHPLSDEYADQGLIIVDGFLATYRSPSEPSVSSPNYLLMGHGGSLLFVDRFPTMVSLYVSSYLGDNIYIDALDADGNAYSKTTDGFNPHTPTPYTPNQLVSFYSPAGFQRLHFSSFFDGRVNAGIDDLTFNYAHLPEPSSGTLLLLGSGFLLWRAHKKARR